MMISTVKNLYLKENDEQSEEQDPCVEVVNYLTYDEMICC